MCTYLFVHVHHFLTSFPFIHPIHVMTMNISKDLQLSSQQNTRKHHFNIHQPISLLQPKPPRAALETWVLIPNPLGEWIGNPEPMGGPQGGRVTRW